MSEAATYIEQGFAGFETCDDIWILWCIGDVEIQEAPPADAGIVKDGEGFAALGKQLAKYSYLLYFKRGWENGKTILYSVKLTTAATCASISSGGILLYVSNSFHALAKLVLSSGRSFV